MRMLAPCALGLALATSAMAAAPPAKSLYDRLGGKGAITAVVGEFVSRLAADKRINARFANADIPRLKQLLVDQICEATGGPCKYTGRDMRTAHAGMGITDAEFGALVEDLKGALDQFKVPAKEQGELLGALAALKPDVVGVPAANTKTSGNLPQGSPPDAVAEKVLALKEAASDLEKAGAARARGNKSFAEQLFSGAELIVGVDALADLAPLFREGAPPRINTPLKQLPRDTPPQPAMVGSSDEDQPDAKPKKGTLSGTLVLEGKTPLEGVGVITLEPASGKFKKRSPKQRVMEQRNRQFAPRLLAVPVGSTVSFPNFDPVFHNVFSRSEAKPFDLGIYKNGQAREMTFDKEGIIRLGCNLHANMGALIVVVGAPHYAVTDAKGHFSFKSLEPGKYKLRAFSESSTAATVQDIVIKPAENTVTVKLAADAAPGTDKFGAPRAKNP